MKTQIMKSIIVGFVWIIVMSLQYSHAQNLVNDSFPLTAPGFSSGTRIQANGVDLQVDSYFTVPCVVDWNSDGKKDLLVGCYHYGNVYLYLNSGSNSEPAFTTGTKLQADGIDISVPYS